MPSKVKMSVVLIFCLLTLGVGSGYFTMHTAVNWLLKREAQSLGMDWASHIENRIPDLDSIETTSGVVNSNQLPDPKEFHNLLADVTSVGHIYQFDFINVLCLCELSIGSYLTDPNNPKPFIDDHSGHDHSGRTRPQSPFSAPGKPPRDIDPQALGHVLKNNSGHATQEISAGKTLQYPIDREFVRGIIAEGTRSIIIRRNVGINQPSTFAEVYHPVINDGEFLYILRVLVNLEKQAKLYTTFFFSGAISGLLLLFIALAYPTVLYFKAQAEQRAAFRRAHFLAHHDVLTNLKNRNDFHEAASNILWGCLEKKQSALLFVFDLNSFKEVNDFHGHQVGDKLLCEFASVLQNTVPEGGYIARLGGDEFVVVIGDISADDIHHQDYLDMPETIQIIVPGSGDTVRVAIAGGVAQYPRDAETIGDLLQAADLALYAAKPNRSGEVCEYNTDMKRDFFDRVQTRDQFRRGLLDSEVEPYYQPIVNMKTGEVEALEALARWNHPERGILTPFVFETVFEDAELCVALGQQMLSKITSDMGEWKEVGVAFGRVGLNVVHSDLKQEGFADNIWSRLDENGLDPSELAIEVTENCLFGADKAKLITVLEGLRAAGHPIALDDFGTGYSSITQLKELPISSVKIDKSFIDDVLYNPTDQSIIRALLNLSKSMEFHLILEGIETSVQRDFLKNMGFVLAQGYYYSHPLPASQVPAFVRRQQLGYDPTTINSKTA